MLAMPPSDEPRPAATVMLLRDGPRGCEVLLLRRHPRSAFAADMWVFPGGTVDPADCVLPAERWRGIDPELLAERFGSAPDLVLGLHAAAVRETFEEAGVLLAVTQGGERPQPDASSWSHVRSRLAERGSVGDWAAWLAEERLVLDLGALAYHSRWVTPLQEPRRYDTAFFVGRVPTNQSAVHDALEVTDQRWVAPSAALDLHARGELAMMYPTLQTLAALSAFGSAAEAVAAADQQPTIRSLRPHIEDGPGGVRVVHPDDPEYDELDRRARI